MDALRDAKNGGRSRSPVTRSPLLLGRGYLVAGLLLSTACGGCSDSPPTPEELCDWQGPGVEVPAWTVERVYDLELRSAANDPSYILGILGLFVDKDAVSVFTRSGYIRTTLDGEVVSRLPHPPIAPVVQTSEGFAGYVDQGFELPPIFCLFSRQGELLEDSCRDIPLGKVYWRAPT